MTGDVGAEVAAVLYDHREGALTCYDHAPTPDRPVWCCVCGAHELTVSWRAHVADALAPLIAVRVEAAKAEALARFDAAVEETSTWCGPFGYPGVAAYFDRRDQFIRAALDPEAAP